MKLLLCKNVGHLGIVGDIVDVKMGYARNCLLPQGLATQPTETNIRKLADARKEAEMERLREREQLAELGRRLEDVEVTVRARATEEGVLYGSVGAREIAAALAEEGFPVESDQVVLDAPIKQLDNIAVTVKLSPDVTATVKVWVVREKAEAGEDGEEDGEAAQTGTEAGSDDDRPID